MTVQVDSDLLLSSWTYNIIETVSVSFNLSLHYSEPNKLINQTAGVSDIKFYNFILEGVRSCDYFELCVGASNIIGQGDDSCVEGSLPFIPSVDMITYSLSRDTGNTNFTLTVTVMVRQVVFAKVFFCDKLEVFLFILDACNMSTKCSKLILYPRGHRGSNWGSTIRSCFY